MDEKKGLKILASVYYFIAALAFYLFMSLAISLVSSTFKGILRMWPYLLYLADAVYLLFVLHLAAHPLDEKKRIRTYEVNGTLILFFAFVVILVSAIYYQKGVYSAWVMGGISPLYPLDSFIGSFLLVIIGSLLYVYGHRLRKKPRSIDYVSFEGGKGLKVASFIFRSIFALVALFFAGSLLLMPFSFDTSFAHFGALFGFYLLMAYPSVLLGYYEWGYLDHDPLIMKIRLFRSAPIFAVIGLALALYYWLDEWLDPYFLISSGQALLPADFMYSTKIGPYLLLIVSIASPLVAFGHFLKRMSPKKKTPAKS